jgi:hypothetical protein
VAVSSSRAVRHRHILIFPSSMLFRTLLKGLRLVPCVLITDTLRGYGAALSRPTAWVAHCHSRYLNNRVEDSHRIYICTRMGAGGATSAALCLASGRRDTTTITTALSNRIGSSRRMSSIPAPSGQALPGIEPLRVWRSHRAAQPNSKEIRWRSFLCVMDRTPI